MPEISRVRGTRDILPAEQSRWRRLETEAGAVARLHGFRRLDTPVIEPVELFERGVGAGTDVVEKEMYAFTDRGGRMLVLRPEATAAVMRAYFEDGFRQDPQPVRLWTTGPMFRYDRPQAGRYRQFHQFNAEIVGDAAAGHDVEAITLLLDWLQRLGITGISLQVNSIGDSVCRPGFRAALVAYYEPRRDQLCEKCRRRLEVNPLRLLDCKERECLHLMADAPRSVDHLCDPCRDHFAVVTASLDRLGIGYQLNPRLVRGLDYYTRTTFEVWHESLGGAQNSLGGGGRYDDLAATLGWPATPGVGFAAGMDRVASLLADEDPDADRPQVLVIPGTDDAAGGAQAVAAALRAADIACVADGSDRSLRARLKAAQRAGFARVIIAGLPDDGERVRLKSMAAEGDETVLTVEQVIAALSGNG